MLKSFATLKKNIYIWTGTSGTNIFETEEIEKHNFFRTKQNNLWFLSPHCFETHWIHFAPETWIPSSVQYEYQTLEYQASNIWPDIYDYLVFSKKVIWISGPSGRLWSHMYMSLYLTKKLEKISKPWRTSGPDICSSIFF